MASWVIVLVIVAAWCVVAIALALVIGRVVRVREHDGLPEETGRVAEVEILYAQPPEHPESRSGS